MLVLVWIFLGLAAGLVASKRFHDTAGAQVLDVTLGVAGAIAGGLAINSLGFETRAFVVVTGLLGAAGGSLAALAGYRSIFRQA